MKKGIYIIVLILVSSLLILSLMKKELRLTCDLEESTISEVKNSMITCNFIDLPFNYIYANTEFYYQGDTHKSQGKLLKPEEFEFGLLYYTVEFETVLTDDKEMKIEFYVSENFFTCKKNEINVKIKQIDLNSGVERSVIYKGKTASIDK